MCQISREAPVKQVTLPRLKLCAAVLLASLMDKVLQVLSIKFNNFYAWSDSTVTMAWISGHLSKWKTYVANRVAEVQSKIAPEHWHHIEGSNNLPDLASRGVPTQSLAQSNLWWYGPGFLQSSGWALEGDTRYECSTELEQRGPSIKTYLITQQEDVFHRISSLPKLLRIMAYCYRFISNCRRQESFNSSIIITIPELTHALQKCVYVAQQDQLEELHYALICKKTNHAYQSLNPFLEGLIRVGGRLSTSQLPFQQQHPLLTPKDHPITKLLINHYHHILLHPGAELFLATLRQKFWINSMEEI